MDAQRTQSSQGGRQAEETLPPIWFRTSRSCQANARGGAVTRVRLIPVALAYAGMTEYGDDFSTEKVRFCSSAAQFVDVELSRFGAQPR